MNIIQILFMGLVEGITELLPVSGSAHQRLLEVLFGISDTGPANQLLKPMLHMGVLLAIVISLWSTCRHMFKELLRMLHLTGKRSARHGKNRPAASRRGRKTVIMTLVSSVPLFVLPFLRGYLTDINKNLFFIGAMLLVTAAVIYGTRHVAHGEKRIDDMTAADAVLIGAAQLPSALAGISRSGITMSLSMWRGLDRLSAVEYSYLIAIPALFGTTILEFVDAAQASAFSWGALLEASAGMAAAALGGCAAVRLIRFVVRKNTFGKFAYYCLGAGLIVLLLALAYI